MLSNMRRPNIPRTFRLRRRSWNKRCSLSLQPTSRLRHIVLFHMLDIQTTYQDVDCRRMRLRIFERFGRKSCSACRIRLWNTLSHHIQCIAVGNHIRVAPFARLAFFIPKAARRTSFCRRAGCDRSVRPALGAADAFANRAVIGTAGAYAADDGDVGTGAAVARSVFVSACHALFDDAGARFKDVAVIAGNFRTSPRRRASCASSVCDREA